MLTINFKIYLKVFGAVVANKFNILLFKIRIVTRLAAEIQLKYAVAPGFLAFTAQH
jgi:hypothetical protein